MKLLEEQALKVLFEGNNYELTRKRFYRDITVLGIGGCKNLLLITSEGATVEYVDPADLVYSYSKVSVLRRYILRWRSKIYTT